MDYKDLLALARDFDALERNAHFQPIDPETVIDEVCLHVERGVNSQDEDHIIFVFANGTCVKMYHDQDCCESVTIEDINGDLNDLLFTPLSVFEERVKEDREEDIDHSETWTFYTLRTNKGSVDIRWYGTSNGYYSESVNLVAYTPVSGLSAHARVQMARQAAQGV